jgi:hypothetical protein
VDTQNEEDTEEDRDRHRMVRNEMGERWGWQGEEKEWIDRG